VARVRIGVVLLVPAPYDREVDGLRRACGEAALDRVPPHLTLVPPVNVRLDALGDALAVVREAAATCTPLHLELGPPATFLPATPTIHLSVGGDPHQVAALHRLRDTVFRPPLERHLDLPFAPHVTLVDDAPPERIPPAVDAIGAYRIEVVFDRVHVLQEDRHGEAHRRWRPIADAPMAPPAVVGRGGLPVELTVSVLADPEALDLERRGSCEGEDDGGESPSASGPVPAAGQPVVVTARRDGRVVGVARGWTDGEHAELTGLTVHPDHADEGIDRHLRAAFDHAVG
jgi:2'-5' RNA ligase